MEVSVPLPSLQGVTGSELIPHFSSLTSGRGFPEEPRTICQANPKLQPALLLCPTDPPRAHVVYFHDLHDGAVLILLSLPFPLWAGKAQVRLFWKQWGPHSAWQGAVGALLCCAAEFPLQMSPAHRGTPAGGLDFNSGWNSNNSAP